MAKRKGKSLAVKEQEAIDEFHKMVQELNEGKISRDQFISWFRSHFGIKGKGILKSFLRQRELARGWDSKTKAKRSSL